MNSQGRSGESRGLCGAAALALALVIAACAASGSTALLTPSASASATAATSASSSSAPQVSATASPEATVAARSSFETPGAATGKNWSSIAWSKLPADSPLLSMRAVVNWRGGYAAYGTNGLWSSADGRTWTQSVTELPADRMIVAETASGLVALQVDAPSCPEATTPCYPSSAGPVVAWTSTNALDWIDRGPAAGITGKQLVAVGGGPAGAVVSTIDGNQSGVAFSSDGTTWKAVTVPSNVNSGCPAAGFGAGRYVLLCPAAKETASGDLPTQPIWSTDGVSWSAGAAPVTGDRPAGMDKLLVGRDGFMATGYIPGEGGSEEWWRSADAKSWQLVAGYGPVGSYTTRGAIPGGTYPDGFLCADGTRLVALALDSVHSSLSGGGWTSADGKSWVKLTGHGTPLAGQFAEIVFPTGVLAGGWWGAAS